MHNTFGYNGKSGGNTAFFMGVFQIPQAGRPQNCCNNLMGESPLLVKDQTGACEGFTIRRRVVFDQRRFLSTDYGSVEDGLLCFCFKSKIKPKAWWHILHSRDKSVKPATSDNFKYEEA